MRIKKANTRVATISVVVFFCIAILCTHAFSQNIRIGSLEIRPSFHEAIEFDDNILQTSGKGTQVGGEEKTSDIKNIFTPGLELMLPFGKGHLPCTGANAKQAKRHNLYLGWHTDFENYRDNAKENQQNSYFTTSSESKYPSGLRIALNNRYVDTVSPAASETDRLHDRKTNTGSVIIGLPHYFRRFDMEFKYQNFDQDYDERDLRRANRNENRFTLKIPFKFMPKIILFPEYTYGFTKYDRDVQSNSHFNEIFAGVELRATAKTTGTIKLGFKSVDYNRSTTADVKTFVASVGVQIDLTKRTILDLNLSRDSQESEFTAGSNAFVENSANLGITHRITRQLTGTLSGNYSKSVFKDSSKTNEIYGLAVSARYDFKKWFFADVNYSHRDKRSSFEAESNRINLASFGIGVDF